MDPFPPGFPFVSRTPEPASEPDMVAVPEPVAEAAPEPAAEPEPEAPRFDGRQPAGVPDLEPQSALEREPWPFPRRAVDLPPTVDDAAPAEPEPAPERDPWPFPRREIESAPLAEPASASQPEREPWPFPKRNPVRAESNETVSASEPEVEAFPFRKREAQAASAPAAVLTSETVAVEAAPLRIAPAIENPVPPSIQAIAQPERPASETNKRAPAAAPVVKDERRKLRRDALSTSALLRVDGVHGPPLKIELCDISIAGARFRSPQKLDVGDKAQVRVEVGPLRWTTRLRVVHCETLEDGSLSIGCAFLRTELLRPWPVAA